MNQRSDSKMKLSSGSVELSNVGGCKAFVFMLLPDKKVKSLKIIPGETKTVPVDPGETTVYHGSEDLRKILAQAVQTPSGKAEQSSFLKKLNSSKLIQINFGGAPSSNLSNEIIQYEKEIIGVFFRTLSLRSITAEMDTKSRKQPDFESKCRLSTAGSIDSVPVRIPAVPKLKSDGNEKPKPDFLLSTRNVNFGTIAPKSNLTQTVQIANNEKEAQAWIIHAKPGQKMDKDKFNPFIVSKHEGTIKPGEKMGIDVRFNPRREGVYNLELILEYHIKSLMGLARTIKKETLVLNGIAKGSDNSFRLDSNFIVFEKEEIQKRSALSSDRIIPKKIKMKNHSKEYLNITISSPEQPFSLGKNEIQIKEPGDKLDISSFINSLCARSDISNLSIIEKDSNSNPTWMDFSDLDLSDSDIELT